MRKNANKSPRTSDPESISGIGSPLEVNQTNRTNDRTNEWMTDKLHSLHNFRPGRGNNCTMHRYHTKATSIIQQLMRRATR